MKMKFIYLLTGLIIFFTNLSYGQNFLDQINFNPQAYAGMEAVSLFEVDGRIVNENEDGSGLKNGLLLKPDIDRMQSILRMPESSLKINFPISENYIVTILLQEVDILANGGLIRTSSGEEFSFTSDMGRFFWGVVEGSPNTMVNISFFENQLIGFISLGMHDFTLGKLDNSEDGLHVFYHNNNLELPFKFECHMTEDHHVGVSAEMSPNNSRSSGNCVNLYVEADYNVFQNKGSVNEAAEYVLGLFSQVFILYAEESIDMSVSELLIWDTPSPYSGNDSFDFLDQFSDAMSGGFNGDLAHLVRIAPQLGGVAWLDVLCGWNPYFRTGFSGIASTYQNVPTYSWSVSVVAHELGHNLGSGHTHACLWNSNNTQIDDCGNVYANNNGFDPEGAACFNSNNPILPSNGGTIMSYCHLISGVGINFNNGFGTQPGNLLRSKVNNANCLGECISINFPVADFFADPTFGCAPLEVQFTDLSTNDPTNWNWEFPGGNPVSSTAQFPLVIYEFAGVFDVSLEVSNNDGDDFLFISDYITVEDVPLAAFSFNADGLTVGFINNSQDAFSYLWDFGDGNFSSEINPVYTYGMGGTYIVQLTVFNNCGEDVFSMQINVFEMPEALFDFDVSSGCAPLTVQFFNVSSGDPDFISWEFPGGTPATSNDDNPVVSYPNAGVFDVTLTVGNPLGSSSLTIDDLIEVFPPTQADFEYETDGRVVTFSNLSQNVDSLSWDFGDGNTSNDTMPVHTYAMDGIYEVVLIAIGGCGTDTISKTIEILTPPVADFDYVAEGECVPVIVTYFNTSSSNTDSVLWLFPGGNPSNSSADTVMVIYESSGTFDFSLIAYGAGGVDTLTVDSFLLLRGAPSGDFDFEIDDFEVFFTQNIADADSWLWDFGDGNSSTDENPGHIFENEGRFDVILRLFNVCDTIEIAKTLTIGDFPSASFSVEGESSGCAPFTVNFINQSTPSSSEFEWFFEGGSPETSTEANPSVTYNSPGLYSVRLTANNPLGEDVLELEDVIEVIGLPLADFMIIEGEDGVFEFINSSSGADSFIWDFGDGNSSTEESPEHQYENSGTYFVDLIAFNICGSDTLTREVQYTFVLLFDELSARLFPNPSSGQVFVEFNKEISSEIRYRVFDVTGKEIKSGELNSGELKYSIDLSSIPAGSYFIDFNADNRNSGALNLIIIQE